MATLNDYAAGKMHDVILVEKRSEPFFDLDVTIYWTMPKYGSGIIYDDAEASAIEKFYKGKSYEVKIDRPDFTGQRRVKVTPTDGIDPRLDKELRDYDD